MNNNEAKYEPKLKPEIKLLLQIQELDKTCHDLARTIQALPLKLNHIETRFQQQQQKLAELKKRKEEILKLHHQAEVELKAAEQKKLKFKSQETTVKTNEEYKALQHEEAQVEEEIDHLEDKIINLLEEEDNVKKQLAEKTLSLEAEKAKAEKDKAQLEAEIRQKEAEHKETLAKRDALVEQLPEELKRFYSHIHERYVGDMVVPVVHGSCKGCFMQLTPHRLVQIHVGEELVFCDKCQRLLAYDTDFDPTNPNPEQPEE